jgi:hypothetical protein
MQNTSWSSIAASRTSRYSSLLRSVNFPIPGLTLLNASLYWPWHWLRVAYDAGNHHPHLVLALLALTVWTWWQLIAAIARRLGYGHQ